MSRPITGSVKLIECLEREGVDTIFGYPGGAIMPVFDALYDSKIKFILTRHEQGATHMADGYARATGKVGVALATSGPGATNTITGIMTAMMDSVPMVVITGQVASFLLGKDAFQESDMTGITYPIVKHSYLVRDGADIPRIVREAFHIASTGRPGPVLIDLPRDIALAVNDAPICETVNLPGYNIPSKADPVALKQAATILAASRRPVLYVGHGAVISEAGKSIMRLAEKIGAPIVCTLLGKGACDETHQQHLGMFGMHGSIYANRTVAGCDCIMAIGARWDDRVTGKLTEFCPTARKIHIDIDPAEFNKILKPDVCLAGDAKRVVDDLIPLCEASDTDAWWKEISAWRKSHPLKSSTHGGLRPPLILEHLNDMLKGRAILVTDVGQHQMWAAQWMQVSKNRHWLSSGGAGTMGYGIPGAIGAQFARPDAEVWLIVGDGGFQMTMTELATAALHKLPIKIILMNNNYLGMVRQWQELFFQNRQSGVKLDGNPDFGKLASAYDIFYQRVKRPADVQKALEKAASHKDGPSIIEMEIVQEDNVFPMVPAGAPINAQLTEAPKKG